MTTDATQTPTDGLGPLVTADTTRADLEEALTHLARRAMRVPWYFDEHQRLHCRINALLGYWETLTCRREP